MQRWGGAVCRAAVPCCSLSLILLCVFVFRGGGGHTAPRVVQAERTVPDRSCRSVCLFIIKKKSDIAVPSKLHFGQIDSFVQNAQYIKHKGVECDFEQEKLMIQDIPWKEVPIPEPKIKK